MGCQGKNDFSKNNGCKDNNGVSKPKRLLGNNGVSKENGCKDNNNVSKQKQKNAV